ncbi:MAG: polyphenol oxidase family protein [Planctomycetota bacterium]
MTLPVHRFASLVAVPGLGHAFSTRSGPGGRPLAISFRSCPEPDLVTAHREAVAREAGAPLDRLVFGEQVHEAGVAVVSDEDAGRGARVPWTAVPRVDALVTREPGLFLAGLSADCPMVFLADPRSRTCALVHSSWRSTVLGICHAAVGTMASVFGTRARDLAAAISPSIGPCCFEVKEDFVAQAMPAFHAHPELLVSREGRTTFDLWEAVRIQLLELGLSPDRIESPRLCTRCRAELFFSHRREGPLGGRNLSVIGWVA